MELGSASILDFDTHGNRFRAWTDGEPADEVKAEAVAVLRNVQ